MHQFPSHRPSFVFYRNTGDFKMLPPLPKVNVAHYRALFLVWVPPRTYSVSAQYVPGL